MDSAEVEADEGICRDPDEMVDDILLSIFGEVLSERLGKSKRVQLILRLFFGLLGATLGIVAAIHFNGRTDLSRNITMQFSMIAMFLFLASFSLFNVAFARKWRWPGVLFILSFIVLLLSRILFGV